MPECPEVLEQLQASVENGHLTPSEAECYYLAYIAHAGLIEVDYPQDVSTCVKDSDC